MKLLTKEVREKLPALGATENDPDPLVYCKLFSPFSSWRWYAIEFDGQDTVFGLVDGSRQEFRYFSLSELQQNRDPMGFPTERDLWFVPCRLSELMQR